MLGDFIVGLVTDRRRRRKGGVREREATLGGVYANGGARDPSVLSCNRSSRTEARGGFSSLKSNGYEKGLVKEVVHDPGRAVPPVRAVFRDTYTFKLKKELFVAVEGTRTSQVWEILQVDLMAPVAKIPMD